MNVGAFIARAGHAVSTQSPATTKTVTGGRSRPFSTVSTGLACWVQPANSHTRLMYKERQISVTHCVYFGADPGVRTEWRLVFNGRPLSVVGVRQPGELGQFWRVDCEEIVG